MLNGEKNKENNELGGEIVVTEAMIEALRTVVCEHSTEAVSYTHLTLPTIYAV